MARSCTVCHHPDRSSIDRELCAGTSVRDVCKGRGLAPSSVNRHKRHITERLAKVEVGKQKDFAGLLLEAHGAKDRMLGIMDSWDRMPEGQRLTMLAPLFAANREYIRCTELLIKVEIARGNGQPEVPLKLYALAEASPDSWDEVPDPEPVLPVPPPVVTPGYGSPPALPNSGNADTPPELTAEEIAEAEEYIRKGLEG